MVTGNVTSVMDLIELYYIELRDFGRTAADKAHALFSSLRSEIGDTDIREAMEFRLSGRARGKNFSYTDSVGFAMAKRLGVRFLTGDRAFLDVPGAEVIR